MAAIKFISLLLSLVIFHTNTLKCIAFPHPNRGIKAAYWPSFGAFPASAIDTSHFTHIYYAFLLPDPTTYKLNVTPFDQTKIPDFMGAIRAKNPPVKTLVSIGGGGNDPTLFSKIVSSRATRQTFIDSTIEIARQYGFDGVDLDWEFPTTCRRHVKSCLAVQAMASSSTQ
ncbi:hypothetical protein SLA2020_445200 [Shorea laevis]